MNVDITSLIASFISCAVFIKLLMPFAVRINLVDNPDHRKMHTGKIPLVGGLAIFLAIIIGMLTTQVDLNQYRSILLSILIIVVVGIVDDHKDISVRARTMMHIVAILIVINNGIELNSLGWIFGEFEFKLHSFSIFFTIFAVLGVMNAVNMSDGIDGLSGLNSLIVFLFITYFSYVSENSSLLLLSLLVVFSLLSFLLFNLSILGRSNKVFMGDTGTTFIGFLIAISLITLSQAEDAVLSPVTALWLMAIPIIDTVTIMLRRIKKGVSPFKADREHLHHFLIKSGYSDNKSLFIVVAISLFLSLIGVWMETIGIPQWQSFLLFVFVLILYFYIITHAWKVAKFINKSN
jgi:UDP-GlcNAc:undecaprenyl-phosphate GlcNAc-1-phosphate transferase